MRSGVQLRTRFLGSQVHADGSGCGVVVFVVFVIALCVFVVVFLCVFVFLGWCGCGFCGCVPGCFFVTQWKGNNMNKRNGQMRLQHQAKSKSA